MGMVTFDSGANDDATRPAGLLRSFLISTHHKTLGRRYLWLALFSVFLGMAMSLLMRVHAVWPEAPFLAPLADTSERYATLPLLHGSLMVFLVLTAAPQAGLGSYFLPLQIGACEMAFPWLSLFSFWTTAVSLFGFTIPFLLAPPSGITLWITSVMLFCLASVGNALNFVVTTIDLRAEGMTLPRLPLTVWAWFINAILSLLIFSILLSACLCLLSDRLLGSHFFPSVNFLAALPAKAAADALPALWQRLFWFFAQAEVYVAMLPCLGIVTHLIATFSRRKVWKERFVVLALCAVGLAGFCVWGEHMFSSGMNPYSPLAFSVLASSLGLPAAFLVLSWLATLWGARVELNTSMLFALGFISLFLSGGLTGIFLGGRDISSSPAGQEYVTGHFHLVMGMAATFAILGALFFWFPKLFGRRLNERLGKTHFWLTFTGVYSIFMPMHWLGLSARSVISGGSGVTALPNILSPVHSFITAAILVTVLAQGIFFGNFLGSLFHGETVGEDNPWRATTLEWSIACPAPEDDCGGHEPVVYRGAYEFGTTGLADDFVPQHLAPTQLTKGV